MGKTADGRLSHPYIEGVNAFINFARAVMNLSGNIPCPCIHCVNCYRQSLHTVCIYLLHRDRIRGEPRNATEDEEVRHFDKLEEDAKRELNPGCTDYSILKFVIKMLNVKVMTNLSNKGLDMMLELLTKVLPKGQGAKDMRWYIDKCVDDGIMRHPADSEEWKEFDLQHPDFALEPRNKNKKFKHNIDVMHVEKNISESTYGTLLSIEGINRDTDKARINLQNMNFRHTLHLEQRPIGSYDKPRAFFSLSPNERDGFYDFLKSVKYPDSYAANISRSVNAKNGRLSGLKSHDCHVLLQRILPIGLQGFADKDISIVLFELGNFFQDLCSKTLKQSELEKLEKRIILILCKLERFFPLTFFNVMVHLVVHLP
ncbi:hypothetical protein SO802_031699 [Lithocarpus litseifolius]|uniref:Uncharacterized protein n=1 Tax=Lithocarpus litseifolius TaxID=425828 RepID=A0AAW2BN02_9ROSI